MVRARRISSGRRLPPSLELRTSCHLPGLKNWASRSVSCSDCVYFSVVAVRSALFVQWRLLQAPETGISWLIPEREGFTCLILRDAVTAWSGARMANLCHRP